MPPEQLPPLDFPGFTAPRYTPVPDEIFDLLLPYLTESELKVLLYICRRTYGFKKDADTISVEQMSDGIVRKDGRRLDWGAGISRKSVQRGIAGLLEKHLIEQTHTHDAAGRDAPAVYRLRWQQGRQFDALAPLNADNLSRNGASDLRPQESDVQHTDNKNGSDGDPKVIAAIRTWAYQHKARVTEGDVAALARAAGTLARWQAVSADARSLADVQARMEG